MSQPRAGRGVGRTASGLAARRGQRGMVTLETAFATLVLAVALAAAIAVAGAVFVLGQCQVTANEVARQAARGDEAAVARATRDAPSGATVTLRREGGVALVEVSWRSSILPPLGPLVARATVLEES